ncbi:MAG: hypothetical protein H6Q00_1963 [Holophagaceae bacterium]|nr:hypothetical protein [Holophagaceae bacterium]
MQYITYLKANTVEDAVGKLHGAGDNAVILAGGTDLLVGFNSHSVDPSTTIVYIGEIETIKAIKETEAELLVGSMVTTTQLAESPVIGRYAGALQQAAQESAGPQVRNRATIGGNIATASPAGDLITALYALDASVTVVGTSGSVRMKIGEIITGVKRTSLSKDQMITEIIIPKKSPGSESAFEKIGKRKAMTISAASAACQVTLSKDQKSIAEIKVAVGAAAPTVVFAHGVEDALRGRAIDDQLVKDVSKLAAEVINPITDQRATKWYRQEVVPVLVYNTIMKAISQVQKAGGVA